VREQEVHELAQCEPCPIQKLLMRDVHSEFELYICFDLATVAQHHETPRVIGQEVGVGPVQ
jgi:hypothetical protein